MKRALLLTAFFLLIILHIRAFGRQDFFEVTCVGAKTHSFQIESEEGNDPSIKPLQIFYKKGCVAAHIDEINSQIFLNSICNLLFSSEHKEGSHRLYFFRPSIKLESSCRP